MFNKRGQIVLSVVIPLVITALFLSLLFFFVYKSSTGTFVYEQMYAKKIALAIDSTSPGMMITLDVSKGVEKAKESGMLTGIFRVEEKKKTVFVSLGGNNGYHQPFYSNYKINFELKEDNKIVLSVEEIEDEE
jgi:hypothetical protein